MRKCIPRFGRVMVALILAVPLPVTTQAAEPADAGTAALRARAAALFGPLPEPPAALSPAAALGRQLFFDARTAADGRTACVACHLPEQSGADGRRFSPDARGRLTGRNSPTVFNVAGQFAQRWRADRPTLAAQAAESLLGSMGWPDHGAAMTRLRELGYGPAFRAAFPEAAEPLTPENYGQALEAFQSTLSTPAPFDRFLAGDDGALSAEQQRGLGLFMDLGCGGCHNGPALGGRQAMKFGVVQPYWELTGSEPVDEGRFAVTKMEADRHVFKVPPLRNVARTGPWFHDGSVAELSRAVAVMARAQLGQQPGTTEVNAIAAFLEGLSGETPPWFSAPVSGAPAGAH